MRTAVPLAWAVLLVSLPARAAEDPRVSDALYRISREASGLWQTAPRYLARELVTQRALRPRRESTRTGSPQFETREIVSYYSLGTLNGAPEALREFRHIFSVEGKPLQSEAEALAAFRQELASSDNAKKLDLIKRFEKTCLSGAATDFGQLILLFTKSNLDKYAFRLAGDTRIGVDNAWLIAFRQQTGNESLHISEAGKKRTEKLQGEIAVRQGDYLPLRIVLNATHAIKRNEIRDEARLDYTVISGALVPAALVYRRFVNGELALESIYRYSDWQPVGPR